MSHDRAAMTLLTAVTQIFAHTDGPIPSRVAAGALMAISGILQERRAPIGLATLEAIMAVIISLRDDIPG